MNNKVEQITTLNALQIEILQTQIRQLKALGKRFTESNLPKLIELLSNSNKVSLQTNTKGSSSSNLKLKETEKLNAAISSSTTTAVTVPSTVISNNPLVNTNTFNSDKNAAPVLPTVAPVPQLSWLCLNSLLFCGSNKSTQEGAIACSPSDFGCFMKSSHLPLVLTKPFVAELREKTLLLLENKAFQQLNIEVENEVTPMEVVEDGAMKQSIETSTTDNNINTCTPHNHSASNDETGQGVVSTTTPPSLFAIQRQMRAKIIANHIHSYSIPTTIDHTTTTTTSINTKLAFASIHPPLVLGPTNYLSELLPYRSFYRTKKQFRRDVRNFEKEEKIKKMKIDEKRKRKSIEFHKALLQHRDDFFRFHKNKRLDCLKVARLTKNHIESLDAKKEKEEARAEARRLQALQENDMEAYANLVQDTKNGRLKFLLNETDSYISTINRMIQEQRVVVPTDESGTTTEDTTGSDAVVMKEEMSEKDMIIIPKSPSNHITSSISSKTTATAIAAATSMVPDASFNTNRVGTGPRNIADTTKDYYKNTHRNSEVVIQPSMLKGGELKEYQLAGLQWLVSLYNNNLNGILADEMGLGKTIQTIAMLCYLMEYKHNKGPFLIVVPLSTLSNWVNEFNKWAPDTIKVVYKGHPDDRKRIFKDEVEKGELNVLLTTYEYIMKDKSSLKKLLWQYIIVDEGHRMKNAQSKFAQILGTVYHSKNRILLTGTPLQNDLAELWSLLNFLLPTIFSSADTFDQWFNKPFASFRNQNLTATNAAAVGADEPPQDSVVLSQEERLLIVHRLHEVLRPFVLRRVKSQVLNQLPEKVEKVLRCNLSGWQRKMYQSIVHKGLLRNPKDGSFISGGLNNTIMQLRKVCNHPYLFIKDYQVDEDLIRISGKFALLDRMLPKLKAGGHRILMFSQMVESINFLEQLFLLRGYLFCRLDGSTPADEREKRVANFNMPDSPYFIFLLSTRAGGLGINLATADTVIIFDSDWNPMMDAQAQDRAHRIGQKKEVRVFRLLTNSPVEERILSRATDKRNLSGLVVEAGKFNVSTTNNSSSNNTTNNQESKEMMEALLNDWSNGTNVSSSSQQDGEEGGEDQQAEDDHINEMMSSNEAELHLYQSVDIENDRNKLIQWKAYLTHMNKPTNTPLPSRLMDASELPHWMTEASWPTKYATLMRDMMSTSTMATIKQQVMTSNTSLKYNKGRPKKSYDDPDFAGNYGNNESDNEENNEDAYVVAGKSMRKRKEIKYDDGMTDLQYSRYVEKQQLEEKITIEAHKDAKKEQKYEGLVGTIYYDLMNIVTELLQIQRDDGSLLASLFVDKPPKLYYPDYYVLITHPIALKSINIKLKKMEYNYLEEVYLDFALMSHNARIYNLDSSPIFLDAELIRLEFHKRTLPLISKYTLISDLLEIQQIPISLPPNTYQIYAPEYVFRMQLSRISRKEDANFNETSEQPISNKKRKRLSLPSDTAKSASIETKSSSKNTSTLEENINEEAPLTLKFSIKKKKLFIPE